MHVRWGSKPILATDCSLIYLKKKKKKGKKIDLWLDLKIGRSVSAYVGLISAEQTLGQAHGKASLPSYHMPWWLTLAEPVQTPFHARVLKNAFKF